jgi:uncharacterized protein (DUF1800 family)
MSDEHKDCAADSSDGAGLTPADSSLTPEAGGLAILGGVLLAGCGAGGGGAAPVTVPPVTPPPPPTVPSGPPAPPPLPVYGPPSAVQAARFLMQAAMGAPREQIARVQALGYAGWLDEQFAMAPSPSRFDWLLAGGYDAPGLSAAEDGADRSQWCKMLSSPDTLRQRVTFALSEILVNSVIGLSGWSWVAFSSAAFLDVLEANAFGNYRSLLQHVSLSAPMGDFLTYRGSRKANPATGSLPDENYARELLQLFTIGLIHLNLDGTPKLSTGLPAETFTLDDVKGLARVFTGWNYDLPPGAASDTPHFKRTPMIQEPSSHESGSKSFLGTTIAAGTDGASSLSQALDAIFAHANVAPFISRQLIQRLVCSNPSPSYVARVATVFNNDGSKVKGNLQAVLKAILLDEEARSDARLADPAFGKLREPVLRLTAWARAFHTSSPRKAWAIGSTSDPATSLGQSPLRAATVFNFFRPGYVPPNSSIASAGLLAPEFQITNETSVIGYVNYMQKVVSQGVDDVRADYSALLPMADAAPALVDELNLLLAAGQLSAATLALIKGTVDSMPSGTQAARLNRIHAVLVLVMASPEFIVQK